METEQLIYHLDSLLKYNVGSRDARNVMVLMVEISEIKALSSFSIEETGAKIAEKLDEIKKILKSNRVEEPDATFILDAVLAAAESKSIRLAGLLNKF